MEESTRGSILILDDDAAFRGLVAGILRPQGYKVVETGSPDEASSLFSRKETVLAIVDYRLPKVDGMTWITKLREAGVNTPVVFCSAVPCDAKTFSWLRNILQVALIIQKPIIPSAFLQQIESLLPGYDNSLDEEGIADTSFYSSDSRAAQSTEALKLEDLKSLSKKLKIEQAVQQARSEYFKQLEEDWKTLTSRIDHRNNNPQDQSTVQDAILITHSIRGTAGSLGLKEIGEISGKLEDFLLYLDPHESTDQEIYWSEIIRAVAKGSELIKEAIKESSHIRPSSVKDRVLILSESDLVIEAAIDPATRKYALVKGTDSPSSFMRYAAENRIDAVIFDTAPSIDNAIRYSASVRQLSGNESIPIGLICLNDKTLTEADLVYIGASDVLYGPVNSDSLRESVEKLLAVTVPGQPRVMVVDDDEVLCKFVSGVLTDQRMEAIFETNPTMVMDRIKEFQPDLVLLDLMMPVMTGYEVCRLIRADQSLCDMPVLFLTSKTSQDARSAAFAVGANDFLTKPVLSEELVARVSAHLASASRKRKERFRDPETKMLRGDAFMIESSRLLASHQKDGEPLGLALIEVDDFDEITIVQGHHAAHGAAVQVGALVQDRFSAESLRARWSSSGYALAVPGVRTEILAGALGMILEDFSHYKFNGNACKFAASFSAGVADSFADGDDLESIIKSAHQRLRTGRRERSGVVTSR